MDLDNYSTGTLRAIVSDLESLPSCDLSEFGEVDREELREFSNEIFEEIQTREEG